MVDQNTIDVGMSEIDGVEVQTLVIDERFDPKVQEAEAIAIKEMQKEFVQSYINKPETLDTKDWLKAQMASKLPKTPPEQINAYADEITSTLETIEQKKAKLEAANNNGRPVESWFYNELRSANSNLSAQEAGKYLQGLETIEQKKAKLEAANNNGRPVESWFYNELRSANSNLSAQEAGKYLQGLDDAIKQANDELADTILTNSGQINQNPNLDGFIAEQHHVNTFNLEAEATGSEYRARVLKPGDSGYRANSVDIVVENKNTGKVASRYQVKYGKDAKATADAFERGDYRGQQKLVPEGQEGDIGKKATTTLEAPDGTKSKPLSKQDAKRMQEEAQSGKKLEYDYNDYKLKDLSYGIAKEAGKAALLEPLSKQDAKRMQEEAQSGKKLEYDYNDYKLKDLSYGIAKEAGKAALLAAAVGTGFHVAKKLWDGEKIDGEEVVEQALKSGADAGIKHASAGALKVLAERGTLSVAKKLWDGEKIDGEEVVEQALKSGADAGIKHASAGALKVLAERGTLSDNGQTIL